MHTYYEKFLYCKGLMKIYNQRMEDLDYTESTKILELEHDSWNQAQNIISRICWESEYYTYLMSLEYKKISLKKN